MHEGPGDVALRVQLAKDRQAFLIECSCSHQVTARVSHSQTDEQRRDLVPVAEFAVDRQALLVERPAHPRIALQVADLPERSGDQRAIVRGPGEGEAVLEEWARRLRVA